MTLKDWIEEFGDNLADVMNKKNISQRELAELSGVPKSSINDYINGRNQPSIKTIVNLSYTLDVSIDELVDFGDTID